MKLSDLDLHTQLSHWQIKRSQRLELERLFSNFTGHIDGAELHSPYTLWENVVYPMTERAKKIKGKKIFVSGGDSLNLDMISPFYRKNGAQTTPEEELNAILKFLKYAQTIYDHIIFLETNHERRFSKILYNSMPDRNQADAVNQMLVTLKRKFEENGLNKLVYVNSFLFQVGDTIFSHFESNSGVAGSIDRSVVQYLVPRVQKEWNLCCQFHTHTQSKLPIDRKVVIEAGAAIDSLDYWRSGRLSGKGKMSSYGYCTMEMKKGKVDINTADFKLCGWEGYL